MDNHCKQTLTLGNPPQKQFIQLKQGHWNVIEVGSGWFLNTSQIVNYTLRFVILWDMLASKHLSLRIYLARFLFSIFHRSSKVSRVHFFFCWFFVGKCCFRNHIGFVGVVESCRYGECKQIALQYWIQVLQHCIHLCTR